MKVTVNCFLNVRVGKPRLYADTFQYLAPGSILEVEDKSHDGDMFEGSDQWLRDGAGNYYWAGGVYKAPENEQSVNQPQSEYNYNRLFVQIPENYRNTKGENIKIAILDTGFDVSHPDLKNRIKDTYNAIDKSKEVGGDSYHGTFMAGLIGASADAHGGITGVAPESELLLVKTNLKAESVLDGLEWAIRVAKAQIINMSFNLGKDDFIPLKDRFQALIADAYTKGVLIFCSGGNNLEVSKQSENKRSPFRQLEDVVYIGSLNKETLSQNTPGNMNEKVHLLAPLLSYKSTTDTSAKYDEDSGCSLATAFFSGMAALLLSGGIASGKIKNTLLNFSLPYKEYEDWDANTSKFKFISHLKP